MSSEYVQLSDYFMRSEPKFIRGAKPIRYPYYYIDSSFKVERFLKEPEHRNHDDLFFIGFLYHRGGMGIEKNYKKAIEFYLRAANEGNLKAYNNLGGLYDAGLGVEQNPILALEYFTKAAHDECPEAYFNIGSLTRNARTQESDFSQAKVWFDHARQLFVKESEKGDVDAQCNLGLLYKSLASGFFNTDKAIHLFRQAAEQGHAEAQYQLGYCLSWYSGRKHEKGLEWSKKHQEALEWFSLAAEQGHPDAQLAAWESPASKKREDPRYLNWLIEAGSHGHDLAPRTLGYFYEHSAPRDFERAFYWFSKGVEHGDRFSMMGLGDLYANGNGVKKNYATALSLYLRSYRLGNGSAWRIRDLYQKGGYGLEKDPNQANYWQILEEEEDAKEADDDFVFFFNS